MRLHLFWQGMLVGFSIAAPVGPIGLLCIRRSIVQGPGYGFISGLGAATADTLYGAVAVFGLTMAANVLTSYQTLLQLCGGAVLCYLGYHTYCSGPSRQAAPAESKGMVGGYLSILLLTLTNPLTILAFVGILAALGIGPYPATTLRPLFLSSEYSADRRSGGCCSAAQAGLLRANFSERQMMLVNKGAGIIIVCFGIILLLNLLRSF